MNNSWGRLGFCLAVVCVLYAFHVRVKTAKIFANPTWNRQDEVGQFWSECAFHYRFAKFFATHSATEWNRLTRDREVQFPDAIDDWAEFTVAMEVPVGVLYRWLKPAIPFHVFVVWYDCLVSSLSLFAIFFLARALWRNDAAGVFASALYASLYPSYGRTVKNLFLREDFAIPLIIFALFFTVQALQTRKTVSQIFAALFWLAALASWHLTQFVMAPLVLAAVLVYLGKGETPRIPWMVLLLAAGAVLVPVLRAKQFYLSPTMSVLYALSLAVWIDGGRRRATILFAGWLAVFVGLNALLQKSFGEYGHVYQLFLYKLRFLGVKPTDPAAMPWDARLLWEGAFETARRSEWWHSLMWCLPLTPVSMWLALRRESVKPVVGRTALRVMVIFTVLLFGLSWMVVRYFTFLGFAAAVMTSGLVTRRAVGKLAVFALTVWQLTTLNFRPLERQQPAPAEYRPVVTWLRENTTSNAVVLGSISDSPVFLAHANRPIIMHSKFENRRIRQRYEEMLSAIYGRETQFAEFAHKYRADFFIFDTDFLYAGGDSRRYKANRLGPLDPNCAAMLFAEHPEQLRDFKLETADSTFAVFRVLKAPSL